MVSDNSPAKVISRLFHNGDYFEHLSDYNMKLFIPKLEKHIEKCQHPKCIEYKNAGLSLSGDGEKN